MQDGSRLMGALLSLFFRFIMDKPEADNTQDVFAILLAAYHPGIKLLGISTVFGNAPLE